MAQSPERTRRPTPAVEQRAHTRPARAARTRAAMCRPTLSLALLLLDLGGLQRYGVEFARALLAEAHLRADHRWALG